MRAGLPAKMTESSAAVAENFKLPGRVTVIASSTAGVAFDTVMSAVSARTGVVAIPVLVGSGNTYAPGKTNETTDAGPFALGGAWKVRLLLSADIVTATGPATGPANCPGKVKTGTESTVTAMVVSNLISGLSVIVAVTVCPIAGVAVENPTL